MRRVLLLLWLLLVPASGFAQIPAWTTHTTLLAFWDAQITRIAAEGSNQWVALTAREMDAIEIGLQQITVGDVAAGRATLNSIGIEVYTFTDTTSGINYYIARELADPGNAGFKGYGTWMFDRGWTRNIAILAPHVPWDANSGDGLRRYAVSGRPRLWGMTGVNRCANSTTASPCSGTFGGCVNNPPGDAYPVSDMAHGVNTSFFAAYRGLLAQEFKYVIEFHTQTTQSVDLVLSNGTTDNVTTGLVATLRTSLANPGQQTQFTLGSCNAVEDDGAGLTLCAGSNTGGRLINGVSRANACTTSASSASGKWLHVESKQTIWNTSAKYNVLFAALNAAIPTDR